MGETGQGMVGQNEKGDPSLARGLSCQGARGGGPQTQAEGYIGASLGRESVTLMKFNSDVSDLG